MSITISGQNNNDKILASDGVLDSISGFSVVGVMTATQFNVGSNIQLGNAGVITATTYIGNLTGNVNSSSNLLLQIGGSEKFRVGSSGQLGIAGANYGTSGQVLTSGGSGSAATWSTITGTTINNNANNRIITGSGTANTLEGEANLTYDGTNLQLVTDANNEGIKLNSTLSGGSSYPVFEMDANRSVGNTLGKIISKWNGTEVASIQISSGTDGTNKDDAHIYFNTASAGTATERLRIDSSGRVFIGGVVSADVGSDNLVITEPAGGYAGMTLRSAVTNPSQITFANQNTTFAGCIQYDNSSNFLRFFVNGANERLRIDSSGRVMIGTTTEGHPNADEFTISFNNTGVSGGDQGRCGMTIRSGDNTSGVTQPGYIYFSDGTSGDNESKGVVAYDHNADELYLSSDGVKAFGLNSSGHFHLGRDYSSNPQNGLVGIVTIRGHRVNEAGDYAHLFFKMSSVGGNASSSIRAFRDGNNYSNGLSFYTHSSNSSTGDGAERMRISRYGYVTKPAHPSFCARHNSGDGFSGDVIVLTRMGNPSWDVWNTGGHYSTSTGKFTAPVTGVYYFEGQLMTTGHSNGDNIQDMLSLMSNNGRISYCRQRESYFSSATNANGYYTNSVGGSTRLSSGDTVWIERHSSQNWSYSNRYYSYFTGWLIG